MSAHELVFLTFYILFSRFPASFFSPDLYCMFLSFYISLFLTLFFFKTLTEDLPGLTQDDHEDSVKLPSFEPNQDPLK